MSDTVLAAQDAPEATVEEAVTVNPFQLTEDHEFKAPEPPKVDLQHGTGTETGIVLNGLHSEIGESIPITTADTYGGIERAVLPPAMPGTPESDYRKCPCIGVMPGRACPRCNCSHWVKTCPKCHGEMFVTVHTRKGAHARTERCGFCMGLGQVPARLAEVKAAEEAARAYTAPVASAKPVYLRGAQLPGVRNSFADRAAKKAAGLKGKKRGHRSA